MSNGIVWVQLYQRLYGDVCYFHQLMPFLCIMYMYDCRCLYGTCTYACSTRVFGSHIPYIYYPLHFHALIAYALIHVYDCLTTGAWVLHVFEWSCDMCC